MQPASTNPATGELLKSPPAWDAPRLETALREGADAASAWRTTTVQQRAELLHGLAQVLLARREPLARLITLEMGKLLFEARAEIEKCAQGCLYYAGGGAGFLLDEAVVSDAGKSYIRYAPLGTVLAVMPWNFPFWQAFRCAVPALCAGNTVLLKHASNVPQCALVIEEVFDQAGFPPGVFRTLLIGSDQLENVISDARVHAVSVTGSVEAGRRVAAVAGANLKKCVLELGGSDAFIVLEDADLEFTVQQAVSARFQNTGQSCIAAKRFIVLDAIAAEFTERFRTAVEKLKPGDPLDDSTTLAPLARRDLRDELHQQVQDSIAAGAVAVTGCAPLPGPGNYYAASILDSVRPGIRAYSEELFGPVASIIRARDDSDAIRIANDTRFGLGGSVWTRDTARGEAIARQLHCGLAFVNGIVRSDPRLPFGGVNDSGYGRELSHLGLREFMNVQTVWVNQDKSLAPL